MPRLTNIAQAVIAEASLHHTNPVMLLTRADVSYLIRCVMDYINT